MRGERTGGGRGEELGRVRPPQCLGRIDANELNVAIDDQPGFNSPNRQTEAYILSFLATKTLHAVCPTTNRPTTAIARVIDSELHASLQYYDN